MSKTFVKISNVGETSVEAFTVLGASSARGEESSIGQFGSGAKHAILCALRAGLSILIYVGRTKIEPFCEEQEIHGKPQQRLCFRIDGKTERSSMVLDFGALDWTDPIGMAMRELISNALDAVGGEWSRVSIETPAKPRAKSGHTQVYIEWCREISEYLGELPQRFLHVENRQGNSVMSHPPGPCRFFRKGVFVHEVDVSNAMYDYNCGDELPIDESRNLDSYTVQKHAARLLTRDENATRRVLWGIVEGMDFWEQEFSQYYLSYLGVADAMRKEYGEDVCVTSNGITHNRAVAKGLNCKHIPSRAAGWFTAAKGGGIKDAISLMSKAESDGLVCFDPSETLLENALQVWDCMASLDLTGSLEFPNLREFEKPMASGASLGGFYSRDENTVFIHREKVDSWKVLIEEFAHYVTGANDETRDFQDYAFRLAGLLMRKVTGQ